MTLAGAQIIDLAMLVIDAQRGIQTQTAECLVLAELVAATRPLSLIVALNKVDLLSGDQTQIDKVPSSFSSIFTCHFFLHS